MAHYALLDENNVVTGVITGKDEGEDGVDWEVHYGNFRGQTCRRTSYNTQGGQHSGGGIPFRKNYAGIGYSYDPVRDAFIPPKPYDSWLLDEDTCQWQPPVPFPTDRGTPENPRFYSWDEPTVSWVEITQ